jgi:hypothetical protein
MPKTLTDLISDRRYGLARGGDGTVILLSPLVTEASSGSLIVVLAHQKIGASMRSIAVLLCLSILVMPSVSSAQQPPSPEEALQGLLTGDKLHDRALGEALKRGYLRGFNDAQQQCKVDIAKAVSECKRSK